MRWLVRLVLPVAVAACAGDPGTNVSAAAAPGAVSSGGLTIVLGNTMGSSFRLTEARIVLDGQLVFERVDPDGATDLQAVRSRPVFRGQAVPGDHALSARLVYKGVCWGVYTYCRDYKFTIQSSHTFSVSQSRASEVRIVAYEKGTVTTPIEERPAIRYITGEPGPR